MKKTKFKTTAESILNYFNSKVGNDRTSEAILEKMEIKDKAEIEFKLKDINGKIEVKA